MNSLFNRVTLLVCSCALVALGRISIFSVVAFLAAVTVSALNYYFSNHYFKIAAIGVFTIVSFTIRLYIMMLSARVALDYFFWLVQPLWLI